MAFGMAGRVAAAGTYVDIKEQAAKYCAVVSVSRSETSYNRSWNPIRLLLNDRVTAPKLGCIKKEAGLGHDSHSIVLKLNLSPQCRKLSSNLKQFIPHRPKSLRSAQIYYSIETIVQLNQRCNRSGD
ncbi:uncharacterized protein LAJ45_03423 [Morchella importuna]|uniref:uncharacterized protein n=1 Tax=Morchella importuna TaxID=1174673 RepID=UPI001E8DF02A|nr:uncharacterized protein LAJ45_03423 [Morchella importuna]KAH8152582.1 hypothetical protein LAJ45_03423 [Morchella importuna]